MNLLNRAITLAAEHHDGQVDKGGEPYILHPLRVMQAAKTDEEKIVAVLHDIVEDTNYSMDDLQKDGFSQDVIEAIGYLTRKFEETYDEFIQRIRRNPLATKVKLLDIADNMNLDRIPNPTQEDYERLEKYTKAIGILNMDNDLKMKIRKLAEDEQPPMELLLLADPSQKLVEEYVQRGQSFIAEVDDHIVGVYVLIPTRPETVELVNIAVDENYQGKGIGKQLVNHAIHHARLLGFKTIEIGTGNSGVGQLALYQKCGFRITGIDRDFFIRHYSEPIYENGIQVVDMVRLSQDLF
jgi:ribosomal protein S18 acetylase RimI-like enzyme